MKNKADPTKTINHFCPVTGLPVTTRPEWHHQNLGDDFQTNFYVIGRSVLYSGSRGTADLESIRKSLTLHDTQAEQICGKNGAYVQIEDCFRLKHVTREARKYFIEHLNQRRGCMTLIFCNASPLLRIFIKIGLRLNTSGIQAHIVGNYAEAIELALNICKSYHMETGDSVFGEKTCYDDTRPSLEPIEILSDGQWDIQTKDYSNRALLIDRCILHAASEGLFRREHVSMTEYMREGVHAAISQDSELEYIIVDASQLKRGSRRARRSYMRSLQDWHRRFPFRIYLLYGVNAFMRTAAYLAKPFMPFRIEVASDLNHAFELLRKDRQQNCPNAQVAKESDPKSATDPIEQGVDELLSFIGSINWEQQETARPPAIRDDHPFSILFQAIRLIKDELDDLFRERRATESELRKSEEKYRELFEKGSDLLCFHDLDGNILDTNLAFKEEYGWHETESLNLRDMICPRHRHLYDDYIERIRSKGKDRGTFCIVTKDGREIILEYNNTMVYDADGNLLGIKGSSRDITAQMQVARENRQLREELRQKHKTEAIGSLAGGIAHDFNNLLGIILGNADLAITDVPESDPAWKKLSEIRNASLRARDMVRQLMRLTRMNGMTKKGLELRPIVESSLKRIRESVPRSVDIHTSLPRGLGEIMADPSQIRQILIHLCTNAAHAMKDNGGTLTLQVTEVENNAALQSQFRELAPGRYIRLMVSDTGCGIGPDIRERIFDPYFTTKEVGQGAGMGLAVVQGLVKNHEGVISIESKVGGGTTVTILFPKIGESGE